MLKCLHRILEMRGSARLYVTTNGTTSLEVLGLVCNALVREILAARRNCFSRKLLRARRYVLSSLMRCLRLASVEQIRRREATLV